MFAVTFKEVVTLSALGVLLLVGALVGLVLLFGLFGARSLVKREFSAYFFSPIAYVVLVVFLAVTGRLFYLTLEQLTASGPRGTEFPMQFLFGNQWFWLIYLVIPPLLTMRLFAEERGSGTLEMLMTAPLRDWQMVLSKYVACFTFYVFLWLPTLAYMPVLVDLNRPVLNWAQGITFWSLVSLGGLAALVLALLSALLPLGSNGRLVGLFLFLGGLASALVGGIYHYQKDPAHLVEMTSGIDPWPVVSTYLGVALAGAMFLALGLLVSSLVRSQLVAFLLALGLSLVFLAAGFWRPDLDPSSPLYQVVFFFSVPLHFSQDFNRGLIDTRHVTLYASVAVLCLFLTVRSLEARRWQ
jgi:ABC-type transport system involved in multi-copper enzyme maturation permease subunit